MIMQCKRPDLRTLLTLAEKKSIEHNGNLTITRTEHEWRAWLGTPEHMEQIQGCQSIEDALLHLIID